MKERTKLALLIVAALIVLTLIGIVGIRMFNSARGLHLPGPEDRHMGEPNVHSWMTPEEVAACYETTTEAVFQAFNIQPEAGDEKLPLRELKDKYGKSRTEMQQGLDQIITSSGPPPDSATDAPKDPVPENWDNPPADANKGKSP